MSFWGVLLMVILPILFLIALVWAVNQWVKFFTGKMQRTPLVIAEERYARGEISQAELEEIKSNLTHR